MTSATSMLGTVRGVACLSASGIRDSAGLGPVSAKPVDAVRLGGRWDGWVQVAERALIRREASMSVCDASCTFLDGVLWGPNLGEQAAELGDVLERQGLSAAQALRGSYSIVFLDHKHGKLLLIADHIRSRNLFWVICETSRRLLFASNLWDLVNLMREESMPVRLDRLAAQYMLTFGYMLDNRTLVEGVQRVDPGAALVFDGHAAVEHEYFRFINEPSSGNVDRESIIDGLEDRFRVAVTASFDWDRQFETGHIATLSGGMDSRSVVIAATQMGYRPILTCTASVSGYLDQTIAARVSKALVIENILYSLDNGTYLEDLRPAVQANDGMVFATGSAHMVAFFRTIDLADYGILHTGMLGDAALGTYLAGPNHSLSEPMSGANSRMLPRMAREIALPVWNKFPNDEAYVLYTRGFNAVLNGYHSLSNWTVCDSPFLDPDFLSFCLSIPPDVRFASTGAGIYKDWVLATRGAVGRYQWERTGVSFAMPTPLARACQRGRGLVRRAGLASLPGSMVPMAQWYRDNSAISAAWNKNFQRGVALLDDDSELLRAASRMFHAGSVPEKGQVLTLLIALEYLGINSK